MERNRMEFSIVPLSEKAVVVQFESDIRLDILSKVLSLQDNLLRNPFPGFIECVPAYCSLTIYFDPFVLYNANNRKNLPGELVQRFLSDLNVEDIDLTNYKQHTIPVCYDKSFGVDLEEMSTTKKLSIEEIIKLHHDQEYTVYMIGFTPGFPYMGTVSKQIEFKRKETPRKKVAAGSIAIAGLQTGIYPFETPGGWQIIGRTPVKLFSAYQKESALLKSGDRVKFERISKREFERLQKG